MQIFFLNNLGHLCTTYAQNPISQNPQPLGPKHCGPQWFLIPAWLVAGGPSAHRAYWLHRLRLRALCCMAREVRVIEPSIGILA